MPVRAPVIAASIWSLLAGCTGFATADELELDEPEPEPPEVPVREIPEAEAPGAAEVAASDAPAPAPAPARKPAGKPAPGVPADARVVMKRTACYGWCPIYRVTLLADGTVEWQGERFVEVRGSATASIDPESFAVLWRALAKQPYDELPSAYTEHTSSYCTSWATDNPSTLVTVEGDGVVHQVVDYHGCSNPELSRFRKVEDHIDSIAGSAKWVGKCRRQPCPE